MAAVLFLFKFQSAGVDAKPFAAFVSRAVVKQMPEVRAAIFAAHFGAVHAIAVIWRKLHVFRIHWVSKTRPASSGIKFRFRRKQRGAAGFAVKHAVLMHVYVFPCKRSFC